MSWGGRLGTCLVHACSQAGGHFTTDCPYPHLPKVRQGLLQPQLSSAHRSGDNISNLALVNGSLSPEGALTLKRIFLSVVSFDFSSSSQDVGCAGTINPISQMKKLSPGDVPVPLNRVGTRPVSSAPKPPTHCLSAVSVCVHVHLYMCPYVCTQVVCVCVCEYT